MIRTHRLALVLFVVLGACDGPAAGVDAGLLDAATDDAATDATIDAAPDDTLDASLADASPDAWAFDAGPVLDTLRGGICAALARQICTAPWDCGCRGVGARPDEDTCVADQSDACVTSLGEEIAPMLTSGVAVLDEDALAVCAARLTYGYSACSTRMIDFNVWCARAFVDRAALGEPCAGPLPLCAGGEGQCFSGTCGPLPGRGQSCGEPIPLCRSGLACRDGACGDPGVEGASCALDSECGAELSCSGGVCRASLGAIGTACAATSECVAGASCASGVCDTVASPVCASDAECGSLERCALEYGPTCVAYLGVGEPCDVDACAPGAYCARSAAGGVCTPLPVIGQPCTESCVAGASCAWATSVCVELGDLGQPCVEGSELDGCRDGLACLSDGTCGAPPDLGQPCSRQGACAGDLRCQFDESAGMQLCTTARVPGEHCIPGPVDPCLTGYFCDYVVESCVARRNEGEACGGDECAPGLDCVYDLVSGAQTCRPIPAIGEACGTTCIDGAACAFGPLPGQCVPQVCEELPMFGGGAPPPD